MDRTIFAMAAMLRRFQANKEFTVVRSKWQRGYKFGPHSALLLVKDMSSKEEVGKKCCLGFLATACGYSDDEIADYTFPSYVSDPSGFPVGLIDIEAQIGSVNDEAYNDLVREKKLTELFSSVGIKVNFVD